MDVFLEVFLAIGSVMAKPVLSKMGERLGDAVVEPAKKFLQILEQKSPELVAVLSKALEQPLDYGGQVVLKVESAAKANPELAQAAQELAEAVKDNLSPELLQFLQNLANTEALKPQSSNIQAFINQLNKSKIVNVDEIKQYLPDATPEQLQNFVLQVESLEYLKSFFRQYPENLKEHEKLLSRAEKALNYKQPYRIAVVGLSGVGKSTFLNALLGDELLLARQGKAATGTALEIFLDSPDGKEKAVVEYRYDRDIRKLIDEFIARYKPNGAKLNGQLNIEFSSSLLRLEANSEITEENPQGFIDLRNTLADIVRQYANINGNINSLKREFLLSNPSDVEDLKKLTDEHSELNNKNSTSRRIGLVKTVTYYFKPKQSTSGISTIQLPGNVCLVDLPGLDGSPLHDIIIRQGIKDADAVIFIQHPNRFGKPSEINLLKNVSNHISLEGSVESGDRIFFILNAKDEIKKGQLSNLPELMSEIMDGVVSDYTKRFAKRGGEQSYFLISAWQALQAQKAINGVPIEDTPKYNSFKESLKITNGSDLEVLEATQVPKLVEELTKFARDYRIEGQIRDGKTAIDNIVDSRYRVLVSEKGVLIDRTGISSSQTQVNKMLDKQREELKIFIGRFRGRLLENFENWRNQQLVEDAKKICNSIDSVLKAKMPQIWEESFNLSEYTPDASYSGSIYHDRVLGKTEVTLWHQLTYSVPDIANHLVELYTEAIETYHLAKIIEEKCLGFVTVAELRLKLHGWINDNMRPKMTEIGSRIALTLITDSKKRFFSTGSNASSENKQLLQIVQSIPPQDKISNLDVFEPFIKAVRQHYESIVSDFCVTALLNLFQYEMLRLQDYLENYRE